MHDHRHAHANHHDLGGRDEYAAEPVCRTDPEDPDEFGARVDALRVVLGSKKIMTTDELRRCVEAIPRDEYFQLQYYERWLRAITAVLLEKQLITAEDLK